MPDEFDAFCERFGNDVGSDVLDRISDAMWQDKRNGGGNAGLRISTIHEHNACNHTIVGEIDHAGETFAFEIDSGDNAGTVIRQWCKPDALRDYEAPKPTNYDLVPVDDTLQESKPHMWKVYLLWRKEQWFQDLVRGYNYDRHFQPGCQTENYYREKARKRGLRFAPTASSNSAEGV